MLGSNRQKSDFLSKLRKLWKNETVRTLLLMGLVVIIVLFFRTILIAALGTEYPLHTPISPSMEPTLNIGDLLIVQGVNGLDEINADHENGDIIVFQKPNNPNDFVVHRAVEKSKMSGDIPFLVTKGDNNPSEDPWKVKEENLIGKVVWRIPLLGYIKIFLGTPVGMAITIIVFLLLIFLERAK